MEVKQLGKMENPTSGYLYLQEPGYWTLVQKVSRQYL